MADGSGGAGIASTYARHASSVTTFFSSCGDRGGSGRLTAAPFCAGEFHSLRETCCPSAVTSSAAHHLVSARRSGYS